jgi:hypothetical protein
MRGLCIIAATAMGFATGCADKAQVKAPAPSPATTNAAIPATPVAKGIEAPRPSATQAPISSPGRQWMNDRDPPDRMPASQ